MEEKLHEVAGLIEPSASVVQGLGFRVRDLGLVMGLGSGLRVQGLTMPEVWLIIVVMIVIIVWLFSSWQYQPGVISEPLHQFQALSLLSCCALLS